MIQIIKNKISQDKKGCGRSWKVRVLDTTSMYNPFRNKKAICGKDKYGLCPSCQATLKADEDNLILAEERNKEEIRFLEHIKQMLISQDTIRKSDSRPTIRTIQKRIDTLANQDNSQQPLKNSKESNNPTRGRMP